MARSGREKRRQRDKLKLVSRFLVCENEMVMELFPGVRGAGGEIIFSGWMKEYVGLQCAVGYHKAAEPAFREWGWFLLPRYTRFDLEPQAQSCKPGMCVWLSLSCRGGNILLYPLKLDLRIKTDIRWINRRKANTFYYIFTRTWDFSKRTQAWGSDQSRKCYTW